MGESDRDQARPPSMPATMAVVSAPPRTRVAGRPWLPSPGNTAGGTETEVYFINGGPPHRSSFTGAWGGAFPELGDLGSTLAGAPWPRVA